MLFCAKQDVEAAARGGASTDGWPYRPCFPAQSSEAGRRIGARAHRRPDAAGPDEGVADGDGRAGRPAAVPTDRPSQTRRIGGGMPQTGDKADARKCAEAKRRVAAQIAQQSSARAQRSGRKEPRGEAPHRRSQSTSADRMCWAGNAGADSRPRQAGRVAWRSDRTRTQSSDCGAVRAQDQAALTAWRVRLRRHFPRPHKHRTH